MKLAGPFYEGDGYIHSRIASKRVAGAAAKLVKTAEVPVLDATQVERGARRLQALALGALVARFFDWLENSARAARQRETEKYLAQATDVCDLEHRMRLLERRGALFG